MPMRGITGAGVKGTDADDNFFASCSAMAAQASEGFVAPFFGASFSRFHSDRFAEQGCPAALTSLARNAKLRDVALGARAEAALAFDQGRLMLRGMLGDRQTFGDLAPSALLAFGSSLRFKSAGVPLDRHALLGEAGVQLRLSDSLSVGVTYAAQIGRRTKVHTGKATIICRW